MRFTNSATSPRCRSKARLRRIRDDQPDILIDLDGYCEGARAELFALRPAPVQVNWLAYPGTLGAPWYDYMIADNFVIRPEQRAHYSEKIAYLPRCFQPSDTTRKIDYSPLRSSFGLPPGDTVFACFNHSWKYTLRSFARWTKILKAVPESILWLLAGPPSSGADEHLRGAAKAAGIDPRRIVFAMRVPHAEHLARYRHVDLFLDTSPYNAHTTASDALWAGCPGLDATGCDVRIACGRQPQQRAGSELAQHRFGSGVCRPRDTIGARSDGTARSARPRRKSARRAQSFRHERLRERLRETAYDDVREVSSAAKRPMISRCRHERKK